jgi:Putative transposase/Transposase zinc-binding domain
VSLAQLKVMSAVETCRTAALGGHVEGCENCGHRRIAYNSCRNRHCPKCQGAAAREWLAAREADLLPVGYFHVVFTVPAEIADIAFHNKAEVYDLLFRVAAETMLTIAADPLHLGARIGITAVLHSWGSAMTHHPHIHMIVPGGGISLDGERWVSSRARFLLPVRVLAKLFRRLFLDNLQQLHTSGRLQFFGGHIGLSERHAFLRHLAPLRKKRWVVYSKPPFSGPQAVLAYLSRYTHRIAISNRRLIAFDEHGVTFRYKDYRRDGADRQRVMTLGTDEFIRRFLLHGLPPHPSLRPPRQRRPPSQCYACSGVACCARTTCGQRYSGARSASAMPLLRRSYGHHRDLSAYGSSAGATIVASLLPDHCTVTRRDEPQPAVEPMRLRPVEGLVPASITRSTTTTSTAGSPWLPPSQHLHHALTQRNYHQVPRVSPIPQSTRHSFIRSRILKSP